MVSAFLKTVLYPDGVFGVIFAINSTSPKKNSVTGSVLSATSHIPSANAAVSPRNVTPPSTLKCTIGHGFVTCDSITLCPIHTFPSTAAAVSNAVVSASASQKQFQSAKAPVSPSNAPGRISE